MKIHDVILDDFSRLISYRNFTILLTSKELCIKLVVLGAKRKKGVFQMNDPSFHLFEMQVCFKGWGVVGKIASPPSTVLCIKCACLLYIWPLITNKKNVCKIKCSRLTGHKSIHCAISSISIWTPSRSLFVYVHLQTGQRHKVVIRDLDRSFSVCQQLAFMIVGRRWGGGGILYLNHVGERKLT